MRKVFSYCLCGLYSQKHIYHDSLRKWPDGREISNVGTDLFGSCTELIQLLSWISNFCQGESSALDKCGKDAEV